MKKDQDQEFSALEEEMSHVFKSARAAKGPEFPHLGTRVLAHLSERSKLQKSLFLWRSLSVGFGALLVMVLAFNFYPRSNSQIFMAQVDQPVSVRVEVGPSANIAFAEINLPPGVTFVSKEHPEIANKSSLELAWKPGLAKNFPFVIRAKDVGLRPVFVRFFDMHHVLLWERLINIQVSGTTGAR